MSNQVKVTINLLSDTIFGSGYSIPGGEDIAVKVDRAGWPYLAGETFKGLLREETANWLDWTGTGSDYLKAFFGENGNWNGNGADKPVYVSPFVLVKEGRPTSPDDCFRTRTFTQIENGVVKKGSLRVASCIKSGLSFEGVVTVCSDDEEDLLILQKALSCIKYLGTDRTRGFGKVQVTINEWEKVEGKSVKEVEGNGNYLIYKMELLEPVRVTNRASTHDTFLDSRGYIPGSTVRGAVLGAIAENSDFFEANKKKLLTEVRFGDAIPDSENEFPTIPTPKGFYDNKVGTDFYHFLVEEKVHQKTKRAGLGAFAVLNDGRIDFWTAKVGENTRINISQQRDPDESAGGMFQTSWLESGQTMTGTILVTEDLKETILNAFSGQMRLGASVHSGCGLCKITPIRFADVPLEVEAYSFKEEDTIPSELYMMLLGPLALVDDFGEPCGITKEFFTDLLGTKVTDIMCSTSVGRIDGFNRKYGTRLPTQAVYYSGSTFKIKCATAPELIKLREIELNGIGMRREEGFGRVLFIKNLAKINEMATSKPRADVEFSEAINRMNRRTDWILNTRFPKGLSSSQIGDFENEIAKLTTSSGDAIEAIGQWFDHNQAKNPRAQFKYSALREFTEQVLSDEDIPADSTIDRLNLIVELIRFSRKGDR